MNTNNYLTITKIFNIEMAHALWNYEGKCRHVHGHSYILHVTIGGIPLHQIGHPEDGMLMDFGKLKQIVKQHIIDIFDHAFVLNSHDHSHESLLEKEAPFDNIIKVPFQPTCENLTLHFSEIIQQYLPKHIVLHGLILYETASAYVKWDNPLV